MAIATDTIAASARSAESRSETIAFLVMVAVLIVAPFFVYPLFLMQALCFALFACAFNLLIGYVGLLSFGHALYFGWASYLAAHAAKVWGFPPELAILTGTRPRAVLGLVAGALAIRRQGIYFAMITLALAQMMFFFALQAKFTGGEDGIQARAARQAVRPDRSRRATTTMYVVVRGHLPRRLPVHPSHHQFAVRRSAQGDPRERAARDLARLQDRPLQAGRLRAVGDARRASPARPRRSCCRSPRSPTCTGRCRARSC